MANKSPAKRQRHHVEISRCEISLGDHIYSPRAGLFDHHGVYIGEDRVIHFQNSVDEKAIGSSIHRHGPCRVCGHHSGRSGVVKSCLDCFLRGGTIYRYEYDFHERLIIWKARLMKWCTSAASDPPETVVARAKELLLIRDGFGKYDLILNNCEAFALYCKTGRRIESGQVKYSHCLPFIVLTSFTLPFVVAFIDWEEIRQARWRTP